MASAPPAWKSSMLEAWALMQIKDSWAVGTRGSVRRKIRI